MVVEIEVREGSLVFIVICGCRFFLVFGLGLMFTIFSRWTDET